MAKRTRHKRNRRTLFTVLLTASLAVLKALTTGWLLLAFRAIFFPFRQPLTALFRLDRLSRYWQRWQSLFGALAFLCWAAVFALIAALACFSFRVAHAPNFDDYLALIACAALFLLFGLVLAMCAWVEDHAVHPRTQRHLAGLRAEEFVRGLIDAHAAQSRSARVLHNALFVFRAGTSREFSAEADSILITGKHIYLIEAKYKSGTIYAREDEDVWRFAHRRGSGLMRNALQQVQNTASVLRREAGLPDAVIPVVAIVGYDVEIVDGPGNVVAAPDLPALIAAFEKRKTPALDPGRIAAGLQRFTCTDAKGMKKHLGRARAARNRARQG